MSEYDFPELRRRFGNIEATEPIKVARIDHAEEARTVLAEVAAGEGNIPDDWAGISDNEQWMISASYAEAHVHATLALVEQTKRIADYLGAWEQGYPLTVQVRS